jgi:hypothetical protein
LSGTEERAPEEAAAAIARLIALCGCRASTPDRREWYWLKAIDLLDRLGDVRADSEPRPLSPERLPVISGMLAQNERSAPQDVRPTGLLERVRKVIPSLAW